MTRMLLRTLAWLTRRDGVVLLYHGVTRRTDGSYLKEADFAEQMEMLAAEFRVVSADEYLAAAGAGRRLARGSVLVTFDDGFRNNLTIVAPIMRRLQLPWVLLSTSIGVAAPGATLWMSMLRAVCRFAPEGNLSLLGTTWPLTDATRRRVYKEMNRVVSRHAWARCRPEVWALIEAHQHHVPRGYIEEHCSLMNGEELRELHASGLVEIGAHTVTHPHLPTVSDDELEREVRGSRDVLAETIGGRIRTFAYPSGAYGRREVELVAASGFDCAFAVSAPAWSPFEIPRIGVYSSSRSVLRLKAHLNELAPTRERLGLSAS
jgi:peptidoglycan/xylan/chitin deacetylase (PgdA/CDA1 family)